jgi:hypothetical protein
VLEELASGCGLSRIFFWKTIFSSPSGFEVLNKIQLGFANEFQIARL